MHSTSGFPKEIFSLSFSLLEVNHKAVMLINSYLGDNYEQD